jgi:hypothetical protein
MDDREKRELQEAIDRIGPEGMKRLGTRIWIGVAVFIVALIVFSVIMNHVCPGPVGRSC